MPGRRVFLDVGGHVGETLSVVISPRWQFDRIWTFEPSKVCQEALNTFVDERVEIVNAGLWSSDTTMELNDPGTLHASVERRLWHDTAEHATFIDAARWMADNVHSDDHVWMKINIEAAEVEVLGRLLDTGELSKVDHLVVHFDVENIGMGEKAVLMRPRLDDTGIEWREARDVMFGRTTETKTETWLLWTYGHRWEFQSRRAIHLARKQLWRARRVLRDRFVRTA